jgi:hypothetical protein
MRFGFGYTAAPGDWADPKEVDAAVAQFDMARTSLLSTWDSLLQRCSTKDPNQVASFLWGRTQSILDETNPNSEIVIIDVWKKQSFTEAMLSRLRNTINEMSQINAELGSVVCLAVIGTPTDSEFVPIPIPLTTESGSGLIWILGLVVLGIVFLKR